MIRRYRWTLLTALASLVLAVPEAHAEVGGPEPPEHPLEGRLLFEQRSCNQCHGIAGGERGIGPDLGPGRFTGSFLDLGAAMWNHVPGMSLQFEVTQTPWPEINEDEVVKLTSFLYFIEYLGRPGDPISGHRLFGSKGCVSCHTIGETKRKVGPDLSRLQRFASPLFVASSIWDHGIPMMEAMRRMNVKPPQFEEGDLADLSAYIRQVSRLAPTEKMLLTPGNPSRGREVFRNKGCRSCHSVRGDGGTGGPDLGRSDLHRSAEGIAGTMWNHAMEMRTLMGERGVGWPDLSTDELADLVAYLYFLPFSDLPGSAARGREIFVSRSCADCHSSGPETSHHGPDLASQDVVRSPAALVAAMWNHAPVMKEAILTEGRPWPELSGADLRDLLAYLSVAGEHR